MLTTLFYYGPCCGYSHVLKKLNNAYYCSSIVGFNGPLNTI